MANHVVAGLVAGAAGTLALNVAGYLDMLVRGRPASRLPARVAGRLVDEIGLPLELDDDADEAETDERPAESTPAQGPLANRQEALGALLGYSNGVGIGMAYGIVRLILPRPPTWLAGTLLGGLAMAASDYPAARLGLTDPAEWSGADWIADVVPHMAYGVVTAWAFEQAKK